MPCFVYFTKFKNCAVRPTGRFCWV